MQAKLKKSLPIVAIVAILVLLVALTATLPSFNKQAEAQENVVNATFSVKAGSGTATNYKKVYDASKNTAWFVEHCFGDGTVGSKTQTPYLVFEADNAVKLTSYTLSPGSQYKDRVPQSWILYGSNTYDSTAEPKYDEITRGNYSSTLEPSNWVVLDEVADAQTGRCSELYKTWISGYNGKQVNINYDDCNPFGMIAGNFGEISSLTKHASTISDTVIAGFDGLSSLFTTFMGKVTISTDDTEYISDSESNSEKYDAYTSFYNKAVEIYNGSLVSCTQSESSDITKSAVIGANYSYTMLFGEGVSSDIDFQTVIANLFGFSSKDTFTGCAQTLADTYAKYRTDIRNSAEVNEALVNGCFYTEDGSFVFPIVIKNATYVVCTYVIVDNNDKVSVWVKDIESALRSVNFNSDYYTDTVFNNEFYCKNVLFGTGIKTVLGDDRYTNYPFSIDAKNQGVYKYYKLVITACANPDPNGGNVELSEIGFEYAKEPFFEALTGSTVGCNSNEAPKSLFDGKKTDGNASKWCATSSGTQQIFIKAKEPITISSYTFYTGNDNATNKGRNPKSWTLSGCNDYAYDETASSSSGGWKSIHAVTDDTTMKDVNYTGYTFTTENMTRYQYYLLTITANQGSDAIQLGEIEFTYSTCEHNFVKSETNIQATCVEPEYELYTCSKCSETRKVKTTTPAKGHDWVTDSTDDATCTEAEKLHQKCSRCTETRTIDGEASALGHDWDEGTITTPVTCTTDGVRTYTCKRCNATDTEDIYAEGHVWGEGTLVSEATCSISRVEHFKCENCTATKDSYVGEPKGHTYQNGKCLRCGKSESASAGEEVGAFTVIGGTKDTDYKYENNILTILTSTHLTIANTNPDTATTTDRIIVAYGVSANITLAGVNINKSNENYISQYNSSNSNVPAFEIAKNSPGDVVITLKADTNNYLYGGYYSAGLQKIGIYGTLTINGKGTLYAYGGQGGAGIGGVRVQTTDLNEVKTVNITITDCTVIAKASQLGDSGKFAVSQQNSSSYSYDPAPGIGCGGANVYAGDNVYDGNIRIINATVTAVGLKSPGIGIAGSGYMSGIVIEGGSVNAYCGKGDGYVAIGGYSSFAKEGEAIAPTNQAGNSVYLLEIANDDGKEIAIDGKYYLPIAHSSTDTNVYAYLTASQHRVWVGDTYTDYSGYDSETNKWKEVSLPSTGEEPTAPKHLIVTAAGTTAITEGADYTYTDGELKILSSTHMIITSNGLVTTDRIVIAVDGAHVTLNNVNIDTSSVNDIAMLVNNSSNGVYIYLAEGSVNTLRSASGYAGLQLDTQATHITYIQGGDSTAIRGVLNAYGGANGAGIGGCFGGLDISNYATINAYGGVNGAGIGTNSGADSKYFKISISNSNVLAVGGENGTGIGLGNGGVVFNNSAIISLHGSTISAIGGNGAPGIGAGSGDVEIYESTIYAVGGNAGTSAGGIESGSAAGVGINGGEIKIILKSSVNAVGGMTDSGANVDKFNKAPVNIGDSALVLLVISNPNGEDVAVDDDDWSPYNSVKLEDTNLYLYLTEADHEVRVGETTTKYYYVDGAFHISSDLITSGVIDGKNYHWYACADSGCEAKIGCTECTADGVWHTAGNEHFQCCTEIKCSNTFNKAAHAYEEKVDEKYLKTPATCTTNAVYYKSCEVCGAIGTEYFKVENSALGHDFEHSENYGYSVGLTAAQQAILGSTYHTKQCDRCGILQMDVDATAYEEHDYKSSCSKNCLKCGYLRSDEELTHNWSPDWTAIYGRHYHVCLNEGCTEISAEVDCTYQKENGDDNYIHISEDGVDKHGRVCTVCGNVESSGYTACTFATKYTDTEHWKECSTCGNKINEGAHSYSDDWKADDQNTKHWKECACGHKINEAEHTSDEWSHNDEYHWKVCTVCEKEYNKFHHNLSAHYNDTEHWQSCSECGATELNKGSHSCNASNDYTCGCGFSKTPVITDEQPRLNFTYSGYTVGGNAKDFKVASDKDNFGIKWDNDGICGYYWWLIDDFDEYNSLYTYWTFSSFGNPSEPVLINSYFRPNTKYWVGLCLEADGTHYFKDFAQGNIYVEDLGYPVYVYTGEVYSGYVYAYFELPELKGEEPTISQMSDIEFELTGKYALGESILTTDVTGQTVFNFEVAPSDINSTQALEYYTTLIINGSYYRLNDEKNEVYYSDSAYYNGDFKKDTWYCVEITVFASEGCDFASYDNASITLRIGDTVYNAQKYYIYSEGKCGVVDYYFDLPFLGEEEHEHDWTWYQGYQDHYRYCTVCGYYEDWEDHVYDNADDCDCNLCGYERRLYVNSLELTFNGYEAGEKIKDATVSINEGFEKYITKAEVSSAYYLRGGDWYDSKNISNNSSLYLPGEVYDFDIKVYFGSYEYNENTYKYLFNTLTCDDIKVYIDGYGYVSPVGIDSSSDSIEIDLVLPAVADKEGCGIFKISDIEYTISGAQVGNKLSDLVITPVKATGIKEWSYEIYYGNKTYTYGAETEETFDLSTAYEITVTFTAEDGYTFTGIQESSIKLNGAYEYLAMRFATPKEMSGTLELDYSFLVTDGAHKHSFDDYGADATSHWKVCACGQKSDIEEHTFVNGECVKCGYDGSDDITSVNLYLEGYKYDSYVRDVEVLSDTANVEVYYWYFGTSDTIFYFDYSSMLDDDHWFYANAEYYLAVVISSESGYFVNLSADNVTLEGHGTAVKITEESSAAYVLFKLDTIKAPHVHTRTDADKVEAVPATCVKEGNIEYYVCSTCGAAVNEEGLELARDEILTSLNPDNHTYKVYNDDYRHGKLCSGCGATADMGYHYYTDGEDVICDYDGCGYQRNPLVKAEFELSGYEVGGKIKDITVALGANAEGILYQENNGDPASYEGFWWCIITDIDAHFSSMNANGGGTNQFYCTTNSSGYADHDRFRSGVDYWLIVWVEADSGYRVEGLTNEDIYIEGLGVAYYFDTYYVNQGYENGYAYFKLNRLEGECDIEAVSDIELDISGYAVDSVISDVSVSVGDKAVIDTKSGWGFRVQDTAVPADGEKFSADKYYVLSLNIKAIDGYDFYGFTRDKITVKGMADAVCTKFEVKPGFGGIYVEFMLPALHEHTYGDCVYANAEQHYKECSTCGYKVYSDHVYDDADDPTCNDCGDVRQLYAPTIELTLNGYEAGALASGVSASVAENSQKYIDSSAVSVSIIAYFLGDVSVDSMCWFDDGFKLVSGLQYLALVQIKFNKYNEGSSRSYKLAPDATVTLNGVEVSYMDSGMLIFVLPELRAGEENEYSAVSDAEYTITGYEIGNKVSDLALTAVGENVGIASATLTVYDEAGHELGSEDVLEANTLYCIAVALTADANHVFIGTPISNIKINGAGYFRKSTLTGVGYLELTYYHKALSDETHTHDYHMDYDDDAHRNACGDCGARIDVEAHVYDSDYDAICNVCGYERIVDIKNVTLYISGYGYGVPAGNIAVWHASGYFGGLSATDYCIATDISVSSGNTGSSLSKYATIEAGVKHYLAVTLKVSDIRRYNVMRVTPDDFTLEGYGTAVKEVVIANMGVKVIFELPALEEPHVHEGTWYAEVSATCVATGTKAHRHCDTCGKDFDAEGREIADITIAINPNAHSFGTWVPEDPATCVSEGTKAHKDCTRCKHHFDANDVEIDDIVIAKNDNHDISSELSKDATGHWYACKRTGCTHKDSFSAHTPDRDSATEYEPVTCTECGYIITPALGHTHNLTFVPAEPATCIKDGSKAYYECSGSRCGKKFEDAEGTIEIADFDNWKVIPASNAYHSFGTWIDGTPANCVDTGIKAHKDCIYCGEHFDSDGNEIEDLTIAVDDNAHNFGTWEPEDPATCVSEGTKAHKDCTRCAKHFDSDGSEIEDIVIAKNDNHDISSDWTKTASGHYHACKRTGCTHKADFSAHTPDRDSATEYEPVTCTICGYIITPALRHTHNLTLVPAEPATCIKDGSKAHYACSGCSSKFEDAEGATEISDFDNWVVVTGTHSFGDWVPEVPATCSGTGTKAHKTCEYCNKNFDAEDNVILSLILAINPSAHSFGDWEEEIPATCSATGTKAHKTCKDCGKHFDDKGNVILSLTLAIDSSAHSFGDWVPEVPATCSATGVQAHKTCKDCGKHFDSDGNVIASLTLAIDSSDHSFGDWVPEVPATCSATGTKAHKDCTLCKRHFDAEGNEISNLTIAIDATAHGTALVKVEAVPATVGSVGNIEYYYCASCGKYYSDATAVTEISLADTLVGKLAPTVIEGNDGEWSDDAQSGLAFKFDALPEDFIGIAVDGIEVSPDNYVVGTDALTIMLKPEFLATLMDGDHTIVISSESGQATATFKVTAVVTPSGDNGSDDGDEGLSAGAWVGIAFGIAGGVAGIAIGVWYLLKYLKRRKTPMPIRTEAPAEPEAQEPSADNNSEE